MTPSQFVLRVLLGLRARGLRVLSMDGHWLLAEIFEHDEERARAFLGEYLPQANVLFGTYEVVDEVRYELLVTGCFEVEYHGRTWATFLLSAASARDLCALCEVPPDKETVMEALLDDAVPWILDAGGHFEDPVGARTRPDPARKETTP